MMLVRNTTHSYGTIALECFALLTQLVEMKYYFPVQAFRIRWERENRSAALV